MISRHSASSPTSGCAPESHDSCDQFPSHQWRAVLAQLPSGHQRTAGQPKAVLTLINADHISRGLQQHTSCQRLSRLFPRTAATRVGSPVLVPVRPQSSASASQRSLNPCHRVLDLYEAAVQDFILHSCAFSATKKHIKSADS